MIRYSDTRGLKCGFNWEIVENELMVENTRKVQSVGKVIYENRKSV